MTHSESIYLCMELKTDISTVFTVMNGLGILIKQLITSYYLFMFYHWLNDDVYYDHMGYHGFIQLDTNA